MNESLVTIDYLGSDKAVAVARLTREKPLNSLLLDTINELSVNIERWLADPGIKCILLDSSTERAFCAGADITALYRSIMESGTRDNHYAQAFFANEYRLDYTLHTAGKPIVVWGNGIVMGGGLGLMGGCSHRIGTPSTRIAMPEITIGLFPDAGGSWLLSHLPDQLGVFMGLTGCQLAVGDALALDLIDIVVKAEARQPILDMLSTFDWAEDPALNSTRLTKALAQFRDTDELPVNLVPWREDITRMLESCVAAQNFLSAFDTLLDELPAGDWLRLAAETYRAGSPTTARIFLEQMSRANGMSLADTFRMELVIACQCIRHPDFPEGVRALLIDKDRNPAWSYPTPAAVPDSVVAEHFDPVWPGVHPLADLGSHPSAG